MNRNVDSSFALAPSVSIGRSRFKRPSELKTSFNVGELIPIFIDEVLPGDTHTMKSSKVVRLQTPIAPFMDNLYLDFFWFFVPMRLTWEHTKQYFGENTESAWIQQTEYTMPQITSPAGGWIQNTLADYFGLPILVPNLSVSALPFRAYALICNEFFRSTALTDPLDIPINDSTQSGSNGTDYITDVVNGGMPFKVAKYFDYFTGALPAPQYGPDVFLGFTGESDIIPVYPDSNKFHSQSDLNSWNGGENTSLHWQDNSTGNAVSGYHLSMVSNGFTQFTSNSGNASGTMTPDNLWAKVSGTDYGFTINQMRSAFQIQKFYERQARSGSRYIEVIKSMFNVDNPDYRLQRPEYLGGNRVPIAVNQVVQTSQTSSTPQGTVAGVSVTSDVHEDFTKSFTEHGYLIGLVCARYDHTYQDGIERFWSRKDKFDHYWPLFANLGEMAILNKEIYAQGNSVVDDDGRIIDEQVFGYQEAYADYRYKPSRVTGEMRSKSSQPLDVWHFADNYNSLPYLSDSWIREDKSNVDRTLQVSSEVSNQLFGDFFFDLVSVRPMPIFSIPGLIDHH